MPSVPLFDVDPERAEVARDVQPRLRRDVVSVNADDHFVLNGYSFGGGSYLCAAQ